MIRPRYRGNAARVLDFDCEARPLSWYGGDWVTKEVTAIAWQFTDRKRTEVRLLGIHETSQLFADFVAAYDQADVVTGHFIRGYDLPVLNGALIELGMPPLKPKLTQDTKLDLVKRSGISVSQENLGALLGLKHEKVQMDQAKWRAANRLTPAGIALTRKRVVGDVKQHIEMRARLLELGLLRSPRMWSGNAPGPRVEYEP